jgi:BNR repeat-like domain
VLALAFLFALRLVPSDSGEYKQPQLAASDKLIAVTFGSGDGIYYTASRDGGQSFPKPTRIAQLPGLMLGRHRGPRIAITRDAIVISAVSNLQGDLVSWRSTDAGRTWSRGAAANQTPRSADEGLHAMVSSRDGSLYAIWLDTPGKGKRLMGARSEDDGATWSKNIIVYASPDGTICQCCHPSLAVGSDGSIHAMWRNALAGDRDMYTAVSRDGGRTFGSASKLGTGSWHLDACPMDGGGISVTPNGKIASVFRRKQEVLLVNGDEPETLLATGKDPAIAATACGVFVAWTAADGLMARVPGRAEPLRLDPDGAFPQLIALPNGTVLAAWEREGEIEFQRLIAGQTR